MSRRDPRVALAHMSAHAREAAWFCAGRSRADLDDDRMFGLAMVRLLEIIGESATRVPESTRALAQDIPWSELVALRNRLIHGYDAVDFDILWRILSDDLPVLVEALERLMTELGDR